MPIRTLQSGAVAMLDRMDGGPVIPMADNDPQRYTYVYSVVGFTPAASPSDILQIQGSSTRIVKLRQVIMSGTASAATNILPLLYRRSTAATGGTPTVQTLLKRDPRDPAATSVLSTFAANPSPLGTSVGIVDSGRLNLAPAANGGIDRLIWQYSWLNEEGLALKDANDFLCLNLGGAAIANSPQLDISLVLTEE